MSRLHLWLMAAGAFAVGAMTATAVPAGDEWCMPTHMPPARYRAMPAPAGAIIVELPLRRIVAAGEAARRGPFVLGAADRDGRTAIIPRRGDVPDACRRAIREHEIAHLNGWTHP